MSKQARVTECELCGGMLKRLLRSNGFHAHADCHNAISHMDARAKRMFGE